MTACLQHIDLTISFLVFVAIMCGLALLAIYVEGRR